MIEQMTEIETADGRMDAFVTHPEEGGPFPAVIVLMDIWGLREELFDIARKIAVVGYHCKCRTSGIAAARCATSSATRTAVCARSM